MQALRICLSRGLGCGPVAGGAAEEGLQGEARLMLDDVDPESTVASLKVRLAALCHVPASCQELVVGSIVLRDEEHLGTRCQPGGAPLEVLMIVSAGRVMRELEHPVAAARMKAVQDLAQLGCHCGSLGVAALAARLEDEVHLVRLAAADALGRVAPPASQEAIDEAAARLEHWDRGVRQAAVKALALVARRGDRGALDAAAARLGSDDPGVRLAAIKALCHLAERGDAQVVAALCRCTQEDPETAVRIAGLWGLQQAVAARGDLAAVAAAASRLEDEEAEVRAAAARALGEVALRGDEGVMAVLTSLLDEDADVQEVRDAAAWAVEELVEGEPDDEEGDEEAARPGAAVACCGGRTEVGGG